MRIRFVKMQGCGNDYIFVDERKRRCVRRPADFARRACDRHFGIGADGVILIRKSRLSDARMMMFNADGSTGEMCGNGIRCLGKYLYERGGVKKKQLRVETLAGVRMLTCHVGPSGIVTSVSIDMGPSSLRQKGLISFQQRSGIARGLKFYCLSMGNPHAVCFVEDVMTCDVTAIGAFVERHPAFPKRTNVEFVEIQNRNVIRLRTWERGSGETLACGTGACAAAVVAILKRGVANTVKVLVRGGELRVSWSGDLNESVWLTGPAAYAFDGDVFEGARG